jgi:hypothetical protein
MARAWERMVLLIMLHYFMLFLFISASVASFRNGYRMAVVCSWLLAFAGLVAIVVYTDVPQLWIVWVSVLTIYLTIKGDIAFDEY